MSQKTSALPGTILTATINLELTNLDNNAKGLATVSLANVYFNEADEDPAIFALCQLRAGRPNGLLIEMLMHADVLEPWPRHTVMREVMLRLTNFSGAAIASRDVELLLMGYPASPIPKASDFTRVAAPAIVNTGPPVEASNGLGAPILCNWLPM